MKKSIYQGIKEHLVNATALVIESTPPLAFLETFISGMSAEVSERARVIGSGLAYLGIGFLYEKGRKFSQKIFGVKKQTRESLQAIHDSLYTAGFSLAIVPPLYLVSGVTDLKELVLGTTTATLFGLVNGLPQGYSFDLLRDLTDIEKCERPSYPDFIKRLPKRIKYGLATLLVGTSIALTAGI